MPTRSSLPGGHHRFRWSGGRAMCRRGISLVGGDAGAGLHVLVAVVRGRIKAWRRPLPDGAAPYLWPSAHG
jgi:hypothetical protein